MYKLYKTLLVSLIITYSISISAVTLEQALTSGYNNNEELKLIRTDFLSEIEQFPRALAEFMPRVYANASSTNSKVKSRSNLAGSNAINSDNLAYSKSITLEQPIFNGWSSVAALKAAHAAFRASMSDFYAREQEAFLNQISVYLECVEAKGKYDISKVSVRSNKTQLEAMKEKFKLGEATETEVASAREGLATAEANQAISYARYEATKANFSRIFGIEPIELKAPGLPDDLPACFEALLKTATETNPAINSARSRIKAFKANEASAKGELLPKISFKLQGGTTDYNQERMASGSINNKNITSVISLNVPILGKGGVEYSDVRRAKYQTRKAAINLDNALKQIKANSKASWSEFAAAKLRISATTQAVKAAKIAYEGIRHEEMLGSKTIIDVLRAEERWNKAKEAELEAEKQMLLSAHKIKALMGGLTAKTMQLNVNYFEPEAEFKKVKTKIVGF